MSSCTVHEGPKPVVVIKGLLGTPEDQVAALEELKDDEEIPDQYLVLRQPLRRPNRDVGHAVFFL